MFNDYNQVDGTGLSNHCLNKRIFLLSTKDNSSCGKSNVFYSFIPQNIQNEYFIYSYFPTLCFCCTSFPNGPLVKEDNISLGSSRNTNLYNTLHLVNGSPKAYKLFMRIQRNLCSKNSLASVCASRHTGSELLAPLFPSHTGLQMSSFPHQRLRPSHERKTQYGLSEREQNPYIRVSENEVF